MSNDRTIHALTRGSRGGEWPVRVDADSRSRASRTRARRSCRSSPPLNAGARHGTLRGDDRRRLRPRGRRRRRACRCGPCRRTRAFRSPARRVGCSPQYGGSRDLLFVGTRDGTAPNALRALNLADGALRRGLHGRGQRRPDRSDQRRRLRSTTRPRRFRASTSPRVRRLGFGRHAVVPRRSRRRGRVFTPQVVAATSATSVGSPVLRGRARLRRGGVRASSTRLDAVDGLATCASFTPAPSDGPVKGFLFPDRRERRPDLRHGHARSGASPDNGRSDGASTGSGRRRGSIPR